MASPENQAANQPRVDRLASLGSSENLRSRLNSIGDNIKRLSNALELDVALDDNHVHQEVAAIKTRLLTT